MSAFDSPIGVVAMVSITQAESSENIAAVQELFREYMAWSNTLEVDNRKAPTFAGFDQELSTLPGVYAPPHGRLLLATHEGVPAGCVGMRRHDAVTSDSSVFTFVQPSEVSSSGGSW